MAVAYVRSAFATPVTNGTDTSITVSSFDSSGGNILVYIVGWRDSGGETNATATFNGSGMTAVPSGANITSGGRIKAWYIDSPSGTGNAVANFTGGAPQRIHGHVLLFSGADVSGTSVGTAANENEGAGATASLTVTTIADGMVVDGLYAREDVNFTVAESGQVGRERSFVTATDTQESSTRPATTTSTTIGWTDTIGAGFAYVAIPINPAAGGSSDTLLWSPVAPLVRRRSPSVVPSGIIGIKAAA